VLDEGLLRNLVLGTVLVEVSVVLEQSLRESHQRFPNLARSVVVSADMIVFCQGGVSLVLQELDSVLDVHCPSASFGLRDKVGEGILQELGLHLGTQHLDTLGLW
jgi:hypothetical protein